MPDHPTRLRSLGTILAGAVLVLPFTGCKAPTIVLTPRLADVGVDGTFGSSIGGTETPTTIEALGLDEDEREFIPRFDFEFSGLTWTIDYGSLEFAGDGTATGTITVDDVTIGASEPVSSRVELALLRSIWTWDFVPTDMVDLGLGVGLSAADVAVALVDPMPSGGEGAAASAEEIVPLPFLAARAAVELGDFGAEALLGIVDVEVDDVEATYVDIDAHVWWEFLDKGVGARLVLGYRQINVEAHFEDVDDVVDADFEFAGPYLGISLVL